VGTSGAISIKRATFFWEIATQNLEKRESVSKDIKVIAKEFA
jgi:hypothetical protein